MNHFNQYTEIARLAGGLAHEIKNPLSTIRLNVELLAEELGEVDLPQGRRALRKVEIVQRECKHLEELLNDFLNFARAHHLELQPADVNREIQEIIEFFRLQAAEAKVEMTAYLASNLPTVMLDRRSFHRALLNLVLNALQAMPNGGKLIIKISYDEENEMVDLFIRDYGCGIPADKLPRIFDRFFSTKTGPDETGKGGSGLGLSSCKSIIEQHKGLIRVESSEGKGTAFTVKLPTVVRAKIMENGDI
jgi:signal transduction histidine kinase